MIYNLALFVKINDFLKKMQGILQLIYSKWILSYSMTPKVSVEEENTLNAAQGD